MKTVRSKLVLIAIIALSAFAGFAQNYDTNNDFVQTCAGSAFSGYLDGQGQATMFANPMTIVSDSQTNLYVWDYQNLRIRKIAPDATVSTFVGGGNQSTGIGTNVSLEVFNYGTVTMAVDRNNTIWVTVGTSLYTITSSAVVSVTNLNLNNGIYGMCLDSSGNIYVSTGNQIYQYNNTNGNVSVFVGSGNYGSIDGNGVFTSFSNPAALASDSADNIYVWDYGNNLIRRVDQSRNVVTIAGNKVGANVDGVGTNASFYGTGVSAMCGDNSGNIYFACGTCIRKMNAQTNVVTIAGNFTQSGYTNGAGNLARFSGADGVCITGGTIYVADSHNYRIRQISFNPQSQVITGANLGIGTFAGVTITGIVGRTYQIQSSPDMAAWMTRATLLLNSSPYLWIDQNPVSGSKFYRALLLP
jgi:sugar lactone lactonase YvrE